MKNALFIFGAGALLVSSLALEGCGKQAAPPPVVEAKPSPTPAPRVVLFADRDFDADKLRARADKAVDSLGKYLAHEDPKLRAKFQRLSNKLVERLGPDKDHWREKLKDKRRELEPQIAKLKERLAREGGDAKEKLSAELSDLQNKRDTTDQKLSKLEAVGVDAWKKFKAQLKADEAREKTPPVDDEADGGIGDGAMSTPPPQS